MPTPAPSAEPTISKAPTFEKTAASYGGCYNTSTHTVSGEFHFVCIFTTFARDTLYAFLLNSCLELERLWAV